MRRINSTLRTVAETFEPSRLDDGWARLGPLLSTIVPRLPLCNMIPGHWNSSPAVTGSRAGVHAPVNNQRRPAILSQISFKRKGRFCKLGLGAARAANPPRQFRSDRDAAPIQNSAQRAYVHH